MKKLILSKKNIIFLFLMSIFSRIQSADSQLTRQKRCDEQVHELLYYKSRQCFFEEWDKLFTDNKYYEYWEQRYKRDKGHSALDPADFVDYVAFQKTKNELKEKLRAHSEQFRLQEIDRIRKIYGLKEYANQGPCVVM